MPFLGMGEGEGRGGEGSGTAAVWCPSVLGSMWWEEQSLTAVGVLLVSPCSLSPQC